MTDDGTGTSDDARHHEAVGSVGEEAAKLLGALSDWARDQGQDYVGSASGAAESFGHLLHDIDEHVSTGGADCRYCPVCQVIRVVRQTSPEVRTNLAMAAGSLMNAAAGLLATQAESQRQAHDRARQRGVEKIDLDEQGGWEDET